MSSAHLWEEMSNPDADGGHRDGGGEVKLCGTQAGAGGAGTGKSGWATGEGAESGRDEGGRPASVACCKGWGFSDGLMSGGARQ